MNGHSSPTPGSPSTTPGAHMPLTPSLHTAHAAAAATGSLSQQPPGCVRADATHAERTLAAHRLLRSGPLALPAPPAGAAAAAAAVPPTPSAMRGASLPAPAPVPSPESVGQQIISVRAVDMQLLKEHVRELKDRLARSATEADYKMYEREQVRRRRWLLVVWYTRSAHAPACGVQMASGP
jgi:hypothetical protein